MIRRTVSTIVLAAATFAPFASHASLFHSDKSGAAVKVKTVKMTLKNRTSEPMQLMVEDQPITIAANGAYDLKAPEGTHVYGADKSVRLLVTRELDGTTCSFR